MDWAFLASVGAPRGVVLIMWVRRVVEKMEEYIREYIVVSICSFTSVEDNYVGLCWYLSAKLR